MCTHFVRSQAMAWALGVSSLCLAPATLQGQARWYSSVVGSDTLALERVERLGNTISGLWVTYRNGPDRHREIMRHEYTVTLGAHDHPETVRLLLRHPAGAVDYTYDGRFAGDTVLISVTPDSVLRRAIPAQHAYPLLGSSIGMFEALIAGERSVHRAPDSTVVVAVPITGPFVARPMQITLLSTNVARLGPRGGPTLFTDARGGIDSIVGAPGHVVRRVGSFDIDAIALAAHQVTPHNPSK
jgi:hypothetical protein